MMGQKQIVEKLFQQGTFYTARRRNYNSYSLCDSSRQAKKQFYKLAYTRPLPSARKFNKLLDSSSSSSLLAYPLLAFCLKKGGILQLSIFNTIIKGFVRQHDLTLEAQRLFKTLFTHHQPLYFQPDSVTFTSIIHALCKTGNYFTSVGLLRLMDAPSCKPDVLPYNKLIHSFCNDLRLDDASILFTEMVSQKNILPNVHTYNSLIYAFSKTGRWDGVTRMLKQMQELKIRLNTKTFRVVIQALCKQGKIQEAKDVIDIMVESGCYPDIAIFNSLIDGYSSLGDMAEARNTFDLLIYRRAEANVDTYNTVMDGYYKNFMPDAASDFFFELTIKGIETHEINDRILWLGHISDRIKRHSLAESALEETYRQYLKTDTFEDSLALFQYMDDNKLNSHIDVYNILIEGATKCFKYDTARRLFHKLAVKGLKPDSKTYTVMIRCLCKGGLLKEARQLLLKMEKSGCPPNYDETINDILHGYLEFKPFYDVVKFCLSVQEIPFSLTDSNASILHHQILLRDPHNYSLLSWVNKVKRCS